MNITLAQLRHLIALAESGSFTVGAKSVNRSQAAFSRSISVMEEALGVVLFDRVGRSNELSPIGRVVLEHARHTVADADALVQAVRVRAHADTDVLRLGLSSTPMALLTKALLVRATTPPRLRVNVTGGTIDLLVLALRERKIDALVVDVLAVPPDPDLLIEPVAKLSTGFLCRPGHPLNREKPVRFADLLQYAIASTGISDEVARRMVVRFGPQAHPKSFVSLCCEDVHSLLDIACVTDAIFLGVLAGGADIVARGLLVPLRFYAEGFDANFGLVRLAGRTEPTAFSVLRKFAQQSLRDPPWSRIGLPNGVKAKVSPRATRQPRG